MPHLRRVPKRLPQCVCCGTAATIAEHGDLCCSKNASVGEQGKRSSVTLPDRICASQVASRCDNTRKISVGFNNGPSSDHEYGLSAVRSVNVGRNEIRSRSCIASSSDDTVVTMSTPPHSLMVPSSIATSATAQNSNGSHSTKNEGGHEDIRGSSTWLNGSDSCPSVSPSPGPDGGGSFVFNDDSTLDGVTEELSAALQAEKDFLDFMCSLPQVQESAQKVTETYEPPPPKEEVSSLDHLGHLCRVVEQLAELKEQNVRLQRRVQYLEDLRLLHQMHRQMTETLAQEQQTLEAATNVQYSNVDAMVRSGSQESFRNIGGYIFISLSFE